MKKRLLFYSFLALTVACNSSEKKGDTGAAATTASADSAVVAKPKNCQSIAERGKLDKSDVYQETAKPVKTTLTLRQDESSMPVANGCVFNNKVEILVARKSGKQEFKRTLLKDDLLAFSDKDEAIQASVLKRATYIPSFNSQKYVTIGMRLTDPQTQKNTDITVYMNYHGEIVKVR